MVEFVDAGEHENPEAGFLRRGGIDVAMGKAGGEDVLGSGAGAFEMAVGDEFLTGTVEGEAFEAPAEQDVAHDVVHAVVAVPAFTVVVLAGAIASVAHGLDALDVVAVADGVRVEEEAFDVIPPRIAVGVGDAEKMREERAPQGWQRLLG